MHAYDNISDENIWAIIQKHLPILKREVDKILNNTKYSIK
ncbi:HepT-like ribonuclease domain-containing protein [Mesohalobacter salilacus]